MNKNIAELIKDIRKINKLTQKQFAKKFFVTEKTISNYENGLRTPDLDFLNRVCKEFNLTIDYFMENSKIKSDSKNLVISEKNGKYAIYDKGQSVYLTPHIYTKIILSNYGYHVGIIAKDLIDEENRVIKGYGEVTYSAIIDNYGNVKEVSDLNFLFSDPFNMFGVCNAKNKEDNKYYLVNKNGEKMSKPFGSIRSVDRENNDEHDFGLYYGIEYDENKHIKSATLLYVDGREIKVTLTDDIYNKPSIINEFFNPWECDAIEFADLDCLLEHIKSFGPNIIAITPFSILRKSENYPKIVEAVCEYVQNLDEEAKCTNFLSYALKLLNKFANLLKPEVQMPVPTNVDKIKIFAQNYSEESNLRRQITDLYAIIGLIQDGFTDSNEIMNNLLEKLKDSDYKTFKITGEEKIKIVDAKDFKRAQDGYRFDSKNDEEAYNALTCKWKRIFGENAYVVGQTSAPDGVMIANAYRPGFPVCFMKKDDWKNLQNWENVKLVAESFDKFVADLKTVEKVINTEKNKDTLQKFIKNFDEENKTKGFYELICNDILK